MDTAPKVIRANQFILEDETGKTRAVLDVSKDGVPGLYLYDDQSTPRAMLSFSEAGLVRSNLGISVDGGFLPDHPRALFDAGAFARVPYMLGANWDEGTLFFIGSTPITMAAEYTAEIFARYGAAAPYVEALYPVSDLDSPQDALIRVVGDAQLVCTTYDVASRVAAARNRTYVYNFARVPPLAFVSLLDLGAYHGAEIPYILGSLPPPAPYTDGNLAAWMQDYWSRFAATGKPKATKVSRIGSVRNGLMRICSAGFLRQR